MSRDNTFYFTHDYNTRNDIKIKKLLARFGLLGYGIFWAIIEELYNNANALPLDYECLAFDLRCEVDVVKSVINDFELFNLEGDTFKSLSVERRLKVREEKSKKAKESANARWNKEKEVENDTNALQSESTTNAIKESKEKKKENENEK